MTNRHSECFVSFSGFRDAESHRFSTLSANWSYEGLVKTQIAGLPFLIWIRKDSDAGRNWGSEEKGTTEDEMAG